MKSVLADLAFNYTNGNVSGETLPTRLLDLCSAARDRRSRAERRRTRVPLPKGALAVQVFAPPGVPHRV